MDPHVLSGYMGRGGPRRFLFILLCPRRLSEQLLGGRRGCRDRRTNSIGRQNGDEGAMQSKLPFSLSKSLKARGHDHPAVGQVTSCIQLADARFRSLVRAGARPTPNPSSRHPPTCPLPQTSPTRRQPPHANPLTPASRVPSRSRRTPQLSLRPPHPDDTSMSAPRPPPPRRGTSTSCGVRGTSLVRDGGRRGNGGVRSPRRGSTRPCVGGYDGCRGPV